jgi:hypothetical protein
MTPQLGKVFLIPDSCSGQKQIPGIRKILQDFYRIFKFL